MDGKPYLKNLEVFGRAVLEDVWTAVVQQFVEVILSVFRKKLFNYETSFFYIVFKSRHCICFTYKLLTVCIFSPLHKNPKTNIFLFRRRMTRPEPSQT